jgi:hypothetical protein
VSVHCQTSGGRSPPFAEFHRQGSLTLENALPRWKNSGGLRPSGFHCAIGGPRAKTEGQTHSLPRCAGDPQLRHTFAARHGCHLSYRVNICSGWPQSDGGICLFSSQRSICHRHQSLVRLVSRQAFPQTLYDYYAGRISTGRNRIALSTAHLGL